jgi:GDP-4-dehydro-6-deoxy-D-mannose reductase
VQIACSSEEYGLVLPTRRRSREDNPLRPLSPYAVSKVAQDLLGYQYFQSYGLKADAHARLQPHRPRRGDVFVMSNFAKQIAEIEAGFRSRCSGSATSTRCATSPTCATWCAPTGWR